MTEPKPQPNNNRKALGVLLAIGGVIWVGQGIGLIPGSFMTGDIRWAIAGAVLLLVAIILLARRS
jgi:hypothetical protein